MLWNPQLQAVDPPKRVVCPWACRGHFSIWKIRILLFTDMVCTIVRWPAYYIYNDIQVTLPSGRGRTTSAAVVLVYCLLQKAKSQSWQKPSTWPSTRHHSWPCGSLAWCSSDHNMEIIVKTVHFCKYLTTAQMFLFVYNDTIIYIQGD